MSGGGFGRTNTWDSQNRLVQTMYNGVTSSFTYGADGLRRSATAGGVTTHYVLDGQNVVQEVTGTDRVTTLWGPRGPEARIAPDGSALHHRPPKHAPGGFSLIELLVVVAIIGILSAILFPVFARARERARQTQCLSNMRHLGLLCCGKDNQHGGIQNHGPEFPQRRRAR